jgi:hypothetical protein
MTKPARFPGVTTVASPRVGATTRRGPNSVDFHIPTGTTAANALLEAAALLEAGYDVTLRVNDDGVAPGRLIVTVEAQHVP